MFQSVMEGNFKSVKVGFIPRSLRSKSPRSTQATLPFLLDCPYFPDEYKPKTEYPDIEKVSSERNFEQLHFSAYSPFFKVVMGKHQSIPEVLYFVEP